MEETTNARTHENMVIKFIVQDRLDGLNEYTRANRSNRHIGNSVKKQNELAVIWAIRQAKLSKVSNYPIKLNITWYEPNSKRDIDNIIFAVKFILDALVKEKILVNDTQKCVNKINSDVKIDRLNPRIEIEIEECE